MAAAFGRASVCAAVLGFSSLTALTSVSALAQVPAGYPADYQKVVDAAKKEGKVVIYSTTDAKVAAPIVKDFEALYPGVKIEFNDMNSTELYNRYVSEQAAGAGSADIVWSSIVDSTFQLGKEYGYAYKSPEAGKLPASAVWKDTVWGMTYEPIAMVYNKRLLKPEEVPKSHAALAALVAAQPERFKNKVTTYDIEKSGFGFMLAVQDKGADPRYFDTLKDMAKAGLVLQATTGTMMERISSGENLVGFNILGSYADTRAKTDPSIGVVYPSDYTLVLPRVMFITKKSKHRNASELWVDYLLSKRGQTVVNKDADLGSIRDDVGGTNNRATITASLGKALKPIPLDESLLTYLAQDKRLEFMKQWRAAAAK
jgi:iron(III) transport system substrate-binding protein